MISNITNRELYLTLSKVTHIISDNARSPMSPVSAGTTTTSTGEEEQQQQQGECYYEQERCKFKKVGNTNVKKNNSTKIGNSSYQSSLSYYQSNIYKDRRQNLSQRIVSNMKHTQSDLSTPSSSSSSFSNNYISDMMGILVGVDDIPPTKPCRRSSIQG
jgi:hypothetical protein